MASNNIEEKIKADIRAGKDEVSVRSYIEGQKLDKDITTYLLHLVDDEVAIQELREVKKRDANLLVYLGIFLFLISIFFGFYHIGFGATIAVVGIVVFRKGRRQVALAMDIESIAELLPDHPTKFHKRRF